MVVESSEATNPERVGSSSLTTETSRRIWWQKRNLIWHWLTCQRLMITGRRATAVKLRVTKKRPSQVVQIRGWARRGSHGLIGMKMMRAVMRMAADQDRDGGVILQVQYQNHPLDHKSAVCSH
jgi:hypothetical protein